MPPPPRVSLELAHPKDLLPRLYENGGLGGLALEGPAPAPVGAVCQFSLHFAEPVIRHFTLPGRLAWARHKGSRALKESFGIDFLPDDRGAHRRLLRLARAEEDPEKARFDERVPAQLPIRLRVGGKRRQESLGDISRWGAFIRTDSPAPVGSAVAIELKAPGRLLPLKLKGRVAWVRGGEAPGMGVELLFDNARQGERVARLVERIAAADP